MILLEGSAGTGKSVLSKSEYSDFTIIDEYSPDIDSPQILLYVFRILVF